MVEYYDRYLFQAIEDLHVDYSLNFANLRKKIDKLLRDDVIPKYIRIRESETVEEYLKRIKTFKIPKSKLYEEDEMYRESAYIRYEIFIREAFDYLMFGYRRKNKPKITKILNI